MNNKNKLILSSAALAMATLVSVGSTFAWFSSNTVVNMNNLNVGIEMAQDENNLVFNVTEKGAATPTQYFNSIDLASNATMQAILTNKVLAPVTTTDGVAYKQKDANNEGYVYTYTADAADTSYVMFDVHFRSNVAVPVYLNTGSAVTSEGAVPGQYIEPWAGYVAGNYGGTVGETQLKPLAQNAVRVLFTDNARKVLWAPNEAEADGKISNATEAGNGKGYWKGNLQADYYTALYGMAQVEQTVNSAINTGLADNYTTLVPVAGDTVYADAENTDKGNTGYESNWGTVSAKEGITPVALMTKNEATGFYEGKCTVTIWLEGTDGDCFNAILNQAITCAFSFSNYKTAQA